MKTINFVRDFTVTPGGRYKSDGKFSGELFRERHLLPCLESDDNVTIDIDGVAGFPSSFLEEAFGGLFRERPGLDLKVTLDKFRITTSDPDLQYYVGLIRQYMTEAARKALVAA